MNLSRGIPIDKTGIFTFSNPKKEHIDDISKISKITACLALVLALALPLAASAQMMGTSNSRNMIGGTMRTAIPMGNPAMGSANRGSGFMGSPNPGRHKSRL